jgi:hypothetical protein
MHELLKNLVERLHEAAGTNLESVLLYGSAARGDFRDGRSDLNVLCTMRSLDVQELARVAATVKWWTSVQKQPAPLFFTEQELRQAADVFAIELVDMQESHKVLYGKDTLEGISVSLNVHCIQVEHELRTVLIKLRQHFLREAANPEQLAAILAKSFSSVMTLLRHTLIAFEEKVPAEPREVISRVATVTGANPKGFEMVLQLRDSETPGGNVISAYGGYLAGLETVISALDRHLPKHQWQRTGKTQDDVIRKEAKPL